ncbi:hypothetical protein QOT17_001749 [Balamuthia mandrillaris]
MTRATLFFLSTAAASLILFYCVWGGVGPELPLPVPLGEHENVTEGEDHRNTTDIVLKANDTHLTKRTTKLLIGVGCQKCGTTSLFAYLRTLKWATTAEGRFAKELHFFDHKLQGHVEAGTERTILDRYLSYWPEQTYNSSPSQHVLVEITPDYMFNPDTPWVMHQVFAKSDVLPHVMLIIMLRNPIQRAYSGYFHGKKGTSDQFKEITKHSLDVLQDCGHNMEQQLQQTEHSGLCMTKGQTSNLGACSWQHCHTATLCHHLKYPHYLSRGQYLDQIQNMLCAGFQPQQMMFFTFHELVENQLDVLQRVSEFVGRPFQFTSNKGPAKVLNGVKLTSKAKGEMDEESIAMLQEFYREETKLLVQFLEQGGFLVDMAALRKEMAGLLEG